LRRPVLVLALLLATLTPALDPPTLDELLEDADVEDRQRIERALFSVDYTIAETIALEEQLARKLQLLEPTFPANAIAIGVDVSIHDQQTLDAHRVELIFVATLSIDLEAIVGIDPGRPLPLPGAEHRRERRCVELGADLISIEISALEERALAERARALGCSWRSR
jgi:hypothetical protein